MTQCMDFVLKPTLKSLKHENKIMSVYTLKYYIDTCMDVEINILTMNRDGFLKFKS